MIDIKAARQDVEGYRAALARRGAGDAFDALMSADAQWRQLTDKVDALRGTQRRLSSAKTDRPDVETLRALKNDVKAAETELTEVAARRDALLIEIPNLPDPTAADGLAEEDSQLVREWGKVPSFAFDIKDHLELGSPRGWVDMARGARMAGSRFAFRFGDIALLEMSIFRYVMDLLCQKGFMPVLGPSLATEKAMYGTGFLPTEESNLYLLEKDQLYLTGTAEVALAAIHMDEILEEDRLPARYVGFSTNFRREAGSAGRDTRGMFRVHQFDKVEMFAYCTPDKSAAMHEELLSYEEEIVQALGVPYRVMNIAVGDLGAPAAKKFDIEAWFPSQGKYREITSCSNTTDYQARRLNARYRSEAGMRFPHTLNGTGATARAMISVMENFQDEKGVVWVPEVLRAHGAPATVGGQ